MVAHGVGKITRQVGEVEGVVGLGSLQGELVLYRPPLLLPVLQLNTQDRFTLTSKAVDLPQAQPELSCDADKSIRLSVEVVHTYPGT